MSEERFEVGKDGTTIFHKPTYVCTDEGKKVTMGFRVCTVDAFVDPKLVCQLLNLGHIALNEGNENVPRVDCDN